MKELLKKNAGEEKYSLNIVDHDTKEYNIINSYDTSEHIDMSAKAFMVLAGDLPYRKIDKDDISEHYKKAIRMKVRDAVLINNSYIVPLELIANPTNTKLLINQEFYSSKLAENIIRPLTKMKTSKAPYLNYDIIVTEINKHIKPYNIYNNNINIQYTDAYNPLNSTIKQIKISIIKNNMSNLINQLTKNGREYSVQLNNINIGPIVDKILSEIRPSINLLSKILSRFNTKTIFRNTRLYDFIATNRTKFFVYLLPFLGYENIKLIIQTLENACTEIADLLLMPTKNIMKGYHPYLNTILENMNEDYFIEASEEFKFKNADEVAEYIINDLQH